MNNKTGFQRVGVLGAGAWGTALAISAAQNDLDVKLWALEPETVADINQNSENKVFLPGVTLPSNIEAVSDFDFLDLVDFVLVVVPTQHVRSVVAQFADRLAPDLPIVMCAKGIEQANLVLPSEIVHDLVPANPLAVLSGPSFAADVARGLPTALTLAIEVQELGAQLAASLGRNTFRIYLSDDLIGAQIGGAVKNVLAIACGIVEGQKLGESARAALIARGFAEMQRLAHAIGAKPQTLAGLSGLGDLILTCSSRQSRNMSTGVALGEGKTLLEYQAGRKSVAEGVHTAQAVIDLAARHGVELPICEAVRDVVQEKTSVAAAIDDLLNRPFGVEG